MIRINDSVVSIAIACGLVSVAAVLPLSAQAKTACGSAHSELGSQIAASRILGEIGSTVVAIGRVDSVSSTNEVEILGLKVHATNGETFQVGDYGVILDWSHPEATDQVLELRPLAYRYVPGASEVFLRASALSVDTSRGRLRIGNVDVDYTGSIGESSVSANDIGNVLTVRGTQPGPRDVVLGTCVFKSGDGSLGTGRPDGSLGTGRPDGSLGTGRVDGSLGTGRE